LAELENVDREAMRKMMESLPSGDEKNATRGYDNILISETSQDEQSARFNNSESGRTISIEQSHEG
jgi:hypothetical protein